MKTILANLLLLLLLLTLFISCKKNEVGNGFNPSKKLYTQSVTQKYSVRLFTNGMEIKNQTVINNFIKNSLVFNLNLSNVDKSYYVTFSATDTAIFNNDNFNFPEKYSIVKKDNQFLFYSGDVFLSNDLPFRYFNDMLKYKYAEKLLPIGGGLDLKQTRFIKVGYGNYNQMEFSLLSYKYIQTSIGGRFFSEQSGITNEFNESVITKVGAKDTLAVQEFSIKYN